MDPQGSKNTDPKQTNLENDKGCCCCCGSYIGVWIFGILYVLGFLESMIGLASCKGIYFCSVSENKEANEDFWVDVESKQRWSWNDMTPEQV